MNTNPKSPSKCDRKTIEKNRRNQLKQLQTQLYSLVPPPPHHASSSTGPKRLTDQFDEATTYIKNLQEEVAKLKQKRDKLVFEVDGSSLSYANMSRKRALLNSPVQIDVHETGGALEVILVTSLEYQFVFTEIIRILHEENAEVFDASYSMVQGSGFHTIHAQIGDPEPSNAAARIANRLKKFSL